MPGSAPQHNRRPTRRQGSAVRLRIARVPHTRSDILRAKGRLLIRHLQWIAAFFLALPAFSSPCRLYLVSQYLYSATVPSQNLGFEVDLEGDSGGASQCTASTLTLAFGLGDGTKFYWITGTQPWTAGNEYVVKAVFGGGTNQLFLDNTLIGTNTGTYLQYATPLLIGDVPSWAATPMDNLIVLDSATFRQGERLNPTTFVGPGKTPAGVFLLQAPNQLQENLTLVQGSVTVTISFHLVPQPVLTESLPLIDQYGQSVQATWPGKITSDDQLTAANVEEAAQLAAWGAPAGYDAYGGITGASWQGAATGFYHVETRNGYYWLITPLGNPVYYTGLCNVPTTWGDYTPVTGRTSLFAQLPPSTGPTASMWNVDVWGAGAGGYPVGTQYVSLHEWNLYRRYAENWVQASETLAEQRLTAWGFSGMGKWSTPDNGVNKPVLPVLEIYTTPTLAGHPDVFSASVLTALQSDLSSQITPYISDPLVLGWSFGNEIDEIVMASEITTILAMGASVPAKQAFVNYALNTLYSGNLAALNAAWGTNANSVSELYSAVPNPPANDIEQLREYYEGQFYATLYATVKSIDPNHLYFGSWIVPGWWVNQQDWFLQAASADVVGYDLYTPGYHTALLDQLLASTNKPVLTGEYGFPPTYRYQKGLGFYAPGISPDDDLQAAEYYASWLGSASSDPHSVGALYFEYRDEPLSGRGPGNGSLPVYGEDYAFGAVDETDRPKLGLVQGMRSANLAAGTRRLQLTN
jgi:hypothetical protein